MAGSTKKAQRRAQQATSVAHEYRAKVALYNAAKWPLVIAAVALPIWAAQGVAREFAGKETAVNVNVAITLSIALALTSTGLGVWAAYQKRRADRLQARNTQLERDVAELQGRLKEADLPARVSR